MNLLRILLIAAIALLAFACDSRQPSPAEAEAAAQRIIDDVTREILQQNPQVATRYSLSDEYMGGDYSQILRDFSPEGIARLRRTIEKGVARMRAIDRKGLSDETLLTLDIALTQWDYVLNGGGVVTADYVYSPYLVNQISGPHYDVPNYLIGQQAITNIEDAEAYVDRIEAMGPMLDGATRTVLQDAERGFIPPKFVLERTIEVIDKFVTPLPGEHALFTNLRDKLVNVEGLDRQQRSALMGRAALAMFKIYPAYRQLSEALRGLLDQAPRDAGIWAQPNGDALYDALVRTQGDTNLTAEQIHQIGIDEVARISAQMDPILRDLGYTEGTIGERLIGLSGDPQFVFPDSDDGREQLMAYLYHKLDQVNALLPQAFGKLPRHELVITRVPDYAESTSPTAYYEDPAPDGSRPGRFFVSLADMAIWPKYDLATLAFHEGNPGHHMQIAISMDTAEMPVIRTVAYFNAHVEGWGLYAERVADELGVYDGDAIGRLGYLRSQLYRAARLVVDTGMHRMHWSREQAIDYFHKTTGTHMTDTVVEIERYAVWPGQALGYMLGQMKFVELRERARTALDDRFDIRAFHDFILVSGPMPLTLLDQRVDAWIRAQIET